MPHVQPTGPVADDQTLDDQTLDERAIDERGRDPRVLDERGRDPRHAVEELAADAEGECSVVADASGGWAVLGHDEAVRVASDPGTFSSAVSAHLQVPNGLDGARHEAFRAVVDPYFSAGRMASLEPVLRRIAERLVASLPRDEAIDAVSGIGSVFAVRAQTAWLGWPADLEPRLLAWMDANHAATRSGDTARTAEVAEAFDAIIEGVVASRTGGAGPGEPPDVTDELLAATVLVDGRERPLARPEVVSILRNWTGGDLGSIALCVGVVLRGLAGVPALQERLRAAGRAEVVAVVDELLRRDDPFVSNRRMATCPVQLGGQSIGAGDRVRIHWTAVNRDERVFGDPDRIDPRAHADANLVYGLGPHACPGRPLASLELAVLVEALLSAFTVGPSEEVPTTREVSPVGGYASVGVVLRPR